MTKKIVTIVPFNGHLDKKFFNKDIIQIGITFIELKKFKSEFWTINKDSNNKNFTFLNQRWIGFKNFFHILINLIINGNKIDLLHLYHISRYSYILGLIYKIVNPKGKIYIKTDISLNNFNGKKIKEINKNILYIFYLFTDFIGFEDKEILNYMNKKYSKYAYKFFFIPSGAIKINDFIGIKHKDNIISLCGRFGAIEKNYELFLDTLMKNDITFLKGWKIQLIGEMTSDFKKKLDILLKEKKELNNIILVCGFIYEKSDLYKLLLKSKIFIHTANSEGEPNVQFDSMFCGNYILSSNVGTIKQNYPKEYSSFFKINDGSDLYSNFKKVVKLNERLVISDYNNIQKHCLDNFTWEKSLKEILNKF